MLTKTIIISDIHGRFNSLRKLIDENKLKDGYKFIFLGDYIGYGKQSLEVVQFLLKLKEKYKEQIIFLYGNWEDMLQKALFSENESERNDYIKVLYRRGFAEDFKQIRNNLHIKNTFKTFFAQLQTYYTTDNYIFAHAGVNEDAILYGKSLEDTIKQSSRNNFIWDETFIDDLFIVKNPSVLGPDSLNDPKLRFFHENCADNIDNMQYNVVVGHVPVQDLAKYMRIELEDIKPIVFGRILAIDLGASKKKGFLGRIMFDEDGKRAFSKVPSIT